MKKYIFKTIVVSLVFFSCTSQKESEKIVDLGERRPCLREIHEAESELVHAYCTGASADKSVAFRKAEISLRQVIASNLLREIKKQFVYNTTGELAVEDESLQSFVRLILLDRDEFFADITCCENIEVNEKFETHLVGCITKGYLSERLEYVANNCDSLPNGISKEIVIKLSSFYKK